MKLFYCQQCGDIVKLTFKDRLCECGKSGAVYIDKLNAETLKAIQLPHVKTRLEEMGGDVRGSTSDEMKNMVASETQKWIQVVNNAKIPKQ